MILCLARSNGPGDMLAKWWFTDMLYNCRIKYLAKHLSEGVKMLKEADNADKITPKLGHFRN